ncbi:MAG: aldolase [Candidatus Lambdaproteobacteria bacterium]|nr:aldolase [Candidatus Lambdaproteobacteria bacterium]
MRNKALERLARGEVCFGLSLHMARTMNIGRMMATCDYDFAFIDMEHNAMGFDIAGQLSLACQDAGVTPIVRVAGFESYLSTRVLDAGAMGIVFPHVNTAKEARELVSICKYPPEGHRSVMGNLPQMNYASVAGGPASQAINRALMIVVMLETPEAVENAEAIAAVPGVDVLHIGTNDLCFEMGIPGQFGHERVKEAYRRVIAACRKHGKHAGTGGVRDETNCREYIQMGAHFLTAGTDTGLLMQALGQRSAFLRGIKL